MNTPKSRRPASAEDRERVEREALLRHVRAAQRSIRSCRGCGLCCTDAYNAVRILPIEAARIAEWIAGLDEARRKSIRRRLDRVIAVFGLEDDGARLYTCAFLDDDFRCAIPAEVKPLACLTFNPVERERCEQEQERFQAVESHLAQVNGRAGWKDSVAPIPVAVRRALRGLRPG